MLKLLQENLTLIVILWVGSLSLVSFFVTVYDKWAAKHNPRHRTRENTLLLLSLLGGSVAMFATMLMIPIMAIVCFFAAMLLCLITNLVEMLVPFIVIGIIGGAIWGNSISKKWVRRYRLRHRISSACYRCKACDKKFRIDTPTN